MNVESAGLPALGGPRSPVVSIVITTRNRANELRTALRSCEWQAGIPFEVLVYDDASSDDTRQVVQEEFPWVRYFHQQTSSGYIVLRNRGYDDARGEFLISIDDDAYFTSADIVRRLAKQMSQSADVAAMAIPYYEPFPVGCKAFSHRAQNRNGPGTSIRSFVGTAHICRVEAVKSVGKYHEFLVHQGEERDLCLRLWRNGWDISIADSPPLVHNVSPLRDLQRIRRWGVRNAILFDFFYTPLALLAPVLVRRLWQLLRYRFSFARAMSIVKWTLLASLDCLRLLSHRQPLGWKDYKWYMHLPRHGPYYLSKEKLPHPCHDPRVSQNCVSHEST